MPYGSSSEEAASARQSPLLKRVLDVLVRVSGLPPSRLDPATSFLELGFDSLLLVQVAQAIDSEFHTKVSIIQLLEELSSAELLAASLAVSNSALESSSKGFAATTPAAASLQNQTEVGGSACALPGPRAVASNGDSLVERVMAQQLEIMRQQIDTLRHLGGSGGSPSSSIPPKPPLASPGRAPASSESKAPPAAFIPPFQSLQVGDKGGGLNVSQEAYLRQFVSSFVRRTSKSKQLTQEHRAVLADARCNTGFKLLWKDMVYPIVGARTSGSAMWDVDGNAYVDITMGFGVHLFGHSPEFITQAIQAQIKETMSLGPQTALAGKVATLLCELTGFDRALFCNSGTEALIGLVRAARTHTRRNRIVVFNGAYHGCADATLVRSGFSDGGLKGLPAAPGVEPKTVEDTLVLEYGSEESLKILKEQAGSIAAVLVEPIQSRRPWLQPSDFLRSLRAITRESGAWLVFDETITGLRSHGRGAQQFFGVEPDVAMYGKHIGGGLPIGVIAGKRGFMDVFDGGPWQYGDDSYPKVDKTLFTGTYFKHPLTLAAAHAVLMRLKQQPGALKEVNERTERLASSLNQICEAHSAPFRVSAFGSLWKLQWLSEPPLKNLFFYHLIALGIYYPIETHNCFLSCAHTDTDVEKIVAAFDQSVLAMRSNGFFFEPGPPNRAAVVSPTPVPSPTPPAVRSGSISFSLYFFGDYPADYHPQKYDLLFDAVRYADSHQFEAVWLPERHFHSFGGFSPNPSVLAAALAGVTQRIHLRAGSVVLPLHHPVRAAEEWAVVDHLSNGRVAISFASGWHPNDFVFAPDNYEARHRVTSEGIDLVRRLWRGESVAFPTGAQPSVPIRLHPQPKQPELPVWVSGVSPQSFETAGRLGVNILTNLQLLTLEELAERIQRYRRCRREAGHAPETGRVTVLMHTYLAETEEQARREAREPFLRYVRSSMDISSGKVVVEGGQADVNRVSDDEWRRLLGAAYDRYLQQDRVLIGTVDSCAPIVKKLIASGVSEIGCLVDFGVPPSDAILSLQRVDQLRQRCHTLPPTPEAALSAVPLTEGQRGLLALVRASDEAHLTYQESAALRLKGPLNVEALERAFQAVIDRHEALRTTFPLNQDAQIVSAPGTWSLKLLVTDLTAAPLQERTPMLLRTHRERERVLMDLEQGPLLRVELCKLEESEFVLVVTLHHLVADGHSYGILFQELRGFYHRFTHSEAGADRSLDATPLPYREFVKWSAEQAAQSRAAAHREYWLRQLEGPLPVLELPTDRPRPPLLTYRGDRVALTLSPQLVRDLRKVGARQHCTLFVMLLGSYQLWLHRLSGQNDVVVAIPSMGPPLSARNDVFGYRIHVLPVRSRITEGVGCSEYFKSVRHAVLEATEHQSVFFGSLLESLHVPRDPSRMPLFSTLFNLDRSTSLPSWGQIQVEEFSAISRNPHGTSRFDVSVNCLERPGGEVLLDLEFNTGLFDRTTLERWMGHWVTLLENLAADPEQPALAIPLLSEAQRQQQVSAWNATEQRHAQPKLLHQCFERQVGLTPDRLAVSSETGSLTYQELEARANQWARHLHALGVGPGQRVILCLHRSLELVTGMLAVLKTGAAYIPVDPDYPEERIVFMIQDAEAAVILADAASRLRLQAASARLISLDEPLPEIANLSVSRLDLALHPESAAYVIYTSGSTGQPKGAMIPHRAICNHMAWMQRAFPMGETDAVLQKTPFSFDASVWEFFAPLLAGARLVLAREGGHRDPEYLVSAVTSHEITVVQMVPSLLRLLVAEPAIGSCTRLKRVFCGGESLTADLIRSVHHVLPWVSVHNLYGPTEVTIDSTCWDFLPGDRLPLSIPIGRPIDNTQCYVLDALKQPVPVGVAGELWLGGAGVGLGYRRRPDLTAERFVPNTLGTIASGLVYRTGDRVRYRAEGDLEFLGRMDQQVKLHGHRIELGEIESVLGGHPTVKECLAMVRTDEPESPRLVAYVVPRPGTLSAVFSEAHWHEQQVSRFEDLYRSAIQETSGRVAGRELEGQILKSTRIQDLESHAIEYYDGTVERILAAKPRRVWEVGCGTGELLLRIAPECQRYWATDLSPSVLDLLREKWTARNSETGEVRLHACLAHDFSALKDERVDLVVLNSVCQYFPSQEYLEQVLNSALSVVSSGGRMFLGDLHDLTLIDECHLAALLKSVPDNLPLEELHRQVAQRVALEDRLLIAPEFFSQWVQRAGRSCQVELFPRRGKLVNEVTQFHYDLVIHVEAEVEASAPVVWKDWAEMGGTLAAVKARLQSGFEGSMGVRGLPNARVQNEVAVMTRLRMGSGTGNVQSLKQNSPAAVGVHPEEIWSMSKELGLQAGVSWRTDGRLDCFDVVFRRLAQGDRTASPGTFVLSASAPQRGQAPCTNAPARGIGTGKWVSSLREALQQKLAAPMVPSAFVVLETLPVLPNGKVDRRALPPPERRRADAEQAYAAPANPMEQKLAEIWVRVLDLPRVSVTENIFDLGADSILISRLSLEARQAGLGATPKLLYQHQTIRDLAAVVVSQPSTPVRSLEELRNRVSALSPEQVRALLATKRAVARPS